MTNNGMAYNIDLVMCIDGTGSMSPYIEEVKRNALSYRKKLVEQMERNDRNLAALRIKVIVFRDYAVDKNPMVISPFFTLSDDQNDESAMFNAFVQNIEATGGGDSPENALEALAYAIKSDWSHPEGRYRQVIQLFTDAPALPLKERAFSKKYPNDLPADFDELTELWHSMSPRAKRLYIFAPDAPGWNQFNEWERTLLTYTNAGVGCGEIDIENLITMVLGSCV